MNKDDLQRTIGIRVKAVRSAKGLNQDDLAKALQLKDRQSISDIENGKRALKPQELILLSDALEKDIEFFIDPFNVVGEAKFSWRASDAIKEADLNAFEEKVGRWIGLLRWLRNNSSKGCNMLNYAPRITRTPSYEDAALCAEVLVKDFNLTEIPATDLVGFVENQLNIPVIFVDAIGAFNNNAISGASCHLVDLGVIIINRNEPESRRNFDLAHELFHILTWDHVEPAHRESNALEERAKDKVRRVEQLANIFASALLMPQNSIEKKIDKSKLKDIKYLLGVASKFKVSPIALGWRLYALNLIDKNVVSQLKKERHSQDVKPKLFSENFIQMLHAAIDQGQLSARKAAKAMSLSLEQLKDLFCQYSLESIFDL